METPSIRTKTAKRASVACTACRQVKLRCDAKATFPQPCSRCKTTSRTCEIDPSFRRTATRNQLEKVTQELSNLQKHLSSPKQPQSSVSPHNKPVKPRDGLLLGLEEQTLSSSALQTLEQKDDRRFEPHNAFGTDVSALAGTSYTLYSVEVTHEETLQLFTFFPRHMYRYLPIIDTTIEFDMLYRDAPLLFWTIIITSSQHHPLFTHLTSLLRQPYERLLGRMIITAPMQLHVMQAVLLLCYWPLPCHRQTADPSWNLWGLIDSAARNQRLSIHTVEQSIWARIWLASFTVGVSLAMISGMEPPFHSSSDLKYVRHLLETTRLPSQLATVVEINLCAVKYVTLSTPGTDLMLQNSTIKLFEAELDMIRQRHANSWDKVSEITLQRTRLNMFSIVCITTSDVTTSSESYHHHHHENVEIFKSSGLQAASKLLSTFSDLVEEVIASVETSTPPENDSQNKVCIPKTYYQAAAYATFFILKFCAFNERLASEDRSLAERMIKNAYSVFMRVSKHPSDEAARAARVVDLLGKTTLQKLRETNRQCASIILDAIQMADDVRGRPPDYHLREHTSDDHSCATTDPQDHSSFEPMEVPTMDDLENIFSFAAFSDEVWQFHDLSGSLNMNSRTM